MWMWLVSALSLTGVVLNIYHRRECFVIWALTNGVWVVYDWKIGAYEQAALFGVYWLLAIWGLIKWKKK